MPLFHVVTPEFSFVDVILDDGTGPLEYGADVIEIEAETARDAIALGVKAMLNGRWHEYRWCKDARADGCSPYAGVKAFPVAEQFAMAAGDPRRA